jgi:uncharacterized protein with NRDE domain
MCTSLIYRDITKKEFGIGFNRDESIKRKPSLAPVEESKNGIKILYPVDGDYGGTWIGVNSKNKIYALLNLYEANLKILRNPKSRGFFVKNLLKEEIDFDFFTKENLLIYYPFRILEVTLDFTRILSWDGESVNSTQNEDPWSVIASSFVLGKEAEEVRAKTFMEEFLKNEITDFEFISSAFLTCHLPEKGAKSPCMHRREAHTVSSTIISIKQDKIKLLYKNQQPCETDESKEYNL